MSFHNPPPIPRVVSNYKERFSEIENQLGTVSADFQIKEVFSIEPPQEWRETIWRKIQKRIFPSAYREDLQHSALLWERYIKYVEDGTVLPMPRQSMRRHTTSTGPR
jgi:hypothetical protein